MSEWIDWDGPVGGGYDQATHVANIRADLALYLTTNPDGKRTFDVNNFMSLAFARLAAIPDPPSDSGYEWLFAQQMKNTDVRPIVEELKASIEGIGGNTVVPDLLPYLLDLQAKAQRVTDYYRKAAEQDVTDLLLTGLGFKIDSNIPPAETINYETRYYRATFVSDWEEESAPSDVSLPVEVGQKDTVTVAQPGVPSGRHIAHWRIYRSNSGNAGAAFQYVPNSADVLGVPVATTTFVDSVKKAALQEVCPSTLWEVPPENLGGLVAMANGINVGFFDKTLCPTPAYVFHAFPRAYRKSVPSTIVGLGSWEQSVFVGTKGKPCFLTGSDPAALTVREVDSNQACLSARSICPTTQGVVYASPDGLCLATPAGVRVVTLGHFTKEEWTALGPSNLLVREHDQVVYMFVLGTVGTDTNYALDLVSGKLTTLPTTNVSALYSDLYTDALYAAVGQAVDNLFAGTVRRTGTWKKLLVLDEFETFAWAEVKSDFTDANGAAASVTLNVYNAAGTLLATTTVSNGDAVRLTPFCEQEIQLEVVSKARVSLVRLTGDAEELSQ